MSTTERISTPNNRVLRNIVAGLAGLSVAGVLVLVTLELQDYSQPIFLMMSLFVFPAPVACGLAVGLLSPRKAIFWAPLWAAIFALMLFALLHGGIRDARIALSPLRLAFMLTGMVLAAGAGVVGQKASMRGNAGKIILAFLALCCTMAVLEYAVLARQMRTFEENVVPEVLLELDRNYIHIPHGLDWQVSRRPDNESYGISAQLDRRQIVVLVSASAPRILGVDYETGGTGKIIENDDAAREYLLDLGIREPLLSSLSRQATNRAIWCAGLDGTRLTLTADGRVSLQSIIDGR